MIEHPPHIEVALSLMCRAGFEVIWAPAMNAHEKHVFVARNRESNELWTVAGQDVLNTLSESMEQCGFEDLD